MTNCKEKDSKAEPEFKLAAADNLDSEEYQIYSLILNENFKGSNDLIVKQSTSGSHSISFGNTYYEALKSENQNLDTTIFIDFDAKNKATYNLDNKFEGSTKPVKLISDEELKYIFDSQDLNKDWNEFYKRYSKSNSMIQFTRVGFNLDKSQAVVEVGNYYASLGADGFIVYLVKENNVWKIVKTINTWVS